MGRRRFRSADKIGADETVSGATVAVKLDLTAQDVPPALVRALCDALKARGAEVFLTDCAPFDGQRALPLTPCAASGYTPGGGRRGLRARRRREGHGL